MKTRVLGFPDSTVQRKANSSGSAYAAGLVLIVGTMMGIVHDTIANGASGSIQTAGRFKLTKNTGVAYTVGQILSWDVTNSYVTTDLSSGVYVRCTEAAGSSDTTVECEINMNCRPREYCKVHTPSAGEDTANVMDITIGFDVASAFVSVWIKNSSGVYRVPGTLTVPSANVLRITEANLAATDKVHVLVREVVGV